VLLRRSEGGKGRSVHLPLSMRNYVRFVKGGVNRPLLDHLDASQPCASASGLSLQRAAQLKTVWRVAMSALVLAIWASSTAVDTRASTCRYDARGFARRITIRRDRPNPCDPRACMVGLVELYSIKSWDANHLGSLARSEGSRSLRARSPDHVRSDQRDFPARRDRGRDAGTPAGEQQASHGLLPRRSSPQHWRPGNRVKLQVCPPSSGQMRSHGRRDTS